MNIDLRTVGPDGELTQIPANEDGGVLAVLVTIGGVQYELSERDGGLRVSVEGGLMLRPIATNAVIAGRV